MQLHPGSVFSSVTEPFRIRLLLLVWESYNRVSISSALGHWPQLRKRYQCALSVERTSRLGGSQWLANAGAATLAGASLLCGSTEDDQPFLLLERTTGNKKAVSTSAAKLCSGALLLACSRESLRYGSQGNQIVIESAFKTSIKGVRHSLGGENEYSAQI